MDLDGSISTEVAIFNKKDEYNDIVTMGLPRSNAGKPVPSQARTTGGLIPKGAKNVAVAKEFLKYLIGPKIVNEYLKVGLGEPCLGPGCPSGCSAVRRSRCKQPPFCLHHGCRMQRKTSAPH
jgi:hypothetical protein